MAPKLECPVCQAPNPADAEACVECGRDFHEGDGTIMLSVEDSQTVILSGDEVDDWPTDALPAVDGADGDSPTEGTPTSAEPGAPGGQQGAFDQGSVLGGRYRIESRLGIGGMGAVYKARDLELDRDVALKVIRPEFEADEEVLARFKQEIILAREITHRNVVRIYDLGLAEGIKFISMEFIEGKDLTALIRESGPLSLEDAALITEQICMALDAAHSEGVVHRDLKPQNVMIAADGRVVVMDFGIARSLQDSSMTQTGALLGTPDYMSPEQVKGEQVDARADIFALGIILFELLTGKLPYRGDTPMATMFKRTQEKATPVRDLNPELPTWVADIIRRCLELQAHKRYQSAREILQDLGAWRGGGTQMTMGPTMMALRPTTSTGSKRLRYGLIGGAVLAAVALIAAGVMLWPSGEPAPEGAATAAGVPAPSAHAVSLAILPFKNASGDAGLDWLGGGLAEMLRTDVGQSASLRTVSSDRVHQILRDLRLTPGASLEEVTLRRIAEFGNAETIVFGQFAKLGDQIRIDVTVRDFERHNTTTLKAEAANEGELLEAVKGLAGEVRASLALSGAGRRELEQQAFMPSSESIAALRHYNEGLALLREGNNLEAVTSLERSIEEDLDFALANAKLAHTYDTLGRGRKAEDASRRAVELSDGLPDAERFMILALNASIEGDYEAGIDAYQNLLRMHPNDPELHAELAAIYEGEASFDHALEHLRITLEADPRNVTAQLAQGRVLIKSGSPQDSLAPLNQGLSLAIQAGNQEAKANALQALGIAYRFLGQPDDALENYQESLAIKREIGDRRGMASSLSEIGNIQGVQGNVDGARQSYNEAIDISREIGDDYGLGVLLTKLGDLERAYANLDEAMLHTREALRIQIEIGDEVNQSQSLNTLGTIYDQRGEYSESLTYYQRALEIRQRLGNPMDIGDSLHNLAETYSFMGNYGKAQDHYLQALEQRRAGADEIGAAYESHSLGRVYVSQGRYAAALAAMEEALEIFRRREESGPWYVEALAGSGNALSLLGRFDEAESVLSGALGMARELGDDLLVAQVLGYQGARELYMSDFPSARELYSQAVAAAEAAEDPYLILAARAGEARSRLMAGEAGQTPVLEGLVKDAQSRGARYLAARCTICLSSDLLAAGRPAEAEPKLRAALREAENMGAAPLVAQSQFLLAETQRTLGNETEAARHLAKAAEILEEIRIESGDGPLTRSDLAPIAAATSGL